MEYNFPARLLYDVSDVFLDNLNSLFLNIKDKVRKHKKDLYFQSWLRRKIDDMRDGLSIFQTFIHLIHCKKSCVIKTNCIKFCRLFLNNFDFAFKINHYFQNVYINDTFLHDIKKCFLWIMKKSIT